MQPMRALVYNMASALMDFADSEVVNCNLVFATC